MQHACAWCHGEIHGAWGAVDSDAVVSHGICPQCSDNLEFQRGVPLARFVQSLPFPVLLARHDDQSLVFECAAARLPGGCQKGICCSGGAIRKAATLTFETGEPLCLEVPVLPFAGTRDASTNLWISTLKAGKILVLGIDFFTSYVRPTRPTGNFVKLGAT